MYHSTVRRMRPPLFRSQAEAPASGQTRLGIHQRPKQRTSLLILVMLIPGLATASIWRRPLIGGERTGGGGRVWGGKEGSGGGGGGGSSGGGGEGWGAGGSGGWLGAGGNELPDARSSIVQSSSTDTSPSVSVSKSSLRSSTDRTLVAPPLEGGCGGAGGLGGAEGTGGAAGGGAGGGGRIFE